MDKKPIRYKWWLVPLISLLWFLTFLIILVQVNWISIYESNGDNTHYVYLGKHLFSGLKGLMMQYPGRYDFLTNFPIHEMFDYTLHPLYSIFLGVLFLVTGASLKFVVVFNAILAAVSIFLMFYLANLLTRSKVVAWLSSICLLFDNGAIKEYWYKKPIHLAVDAGRELKGS